MKTPLEIFQRVLERFNASFHALQKNVPGPESENFAWFVIESMSGPNRHFHIPTHALHVAEGQQPLGVIAALFHDVVYAQVDEGVSSYVRNCIGKYLHFEGNQYAIAQNAGEDIYFELVLKVFGFGRGQKLSTKDGENEFLSALVAVEKLRGILGIEELLTVVTCIEATIPFRGDILGHKGLYNRLQSVSNDLHLNLTEDALDHIMHQAVAVANKDVDNFCAENCKDFLENTWNLLPENNPKLRSHCMYSIREYRKALYSMEKFFLKSSPDKIHLQHKNLPSDKDFKKKIAKTKQNLDLGSQYLQIKLYTIAILESLADMTGGDVPLVYFKGDLLPATGNKLPIEAFLKTSKEKNTDLDLSLLLLLKEGRSKPVNFDTNSSPLASFIYQFLEKPKLAAGQEDARRMFEGEFTSKQFLQKQDRSLVQHIANAVAHFATLRKDKLQNISSVLDAK